MGAAPVLSILRNGETIKSLSLENEVVLGRAEGCVIRLEDRAISRQHAVISPTADGYQIEKKSEFSPLLVNGAECTRAMVKEGDVVEIGPYLMKVTVAKANHADSAASNQPMTAVMAHALGLAAMPGDASAVGPQNPAAPTAAAPHSPDPVGTLVIPGVIPGPGGGGMSVVPPASTGASAQEQDSPADALGVENATQNLMVDEDAATRIGVDAKLSVKLVFPRGAANVTEYEVTKNEVIIGRGKDCDIVLHDKKASRKNTIIRRSGMSFVIIDLDSSNGTYVNDVKVKETSLPGDAEVRIGDVRFLFKAMSADYLEREKDFEALPLPASPSSDSNPQAVPLDAQSAEVSKGEQSQSMDASAQSSVDLQSSAIQVDTGGVGLANVSSPMELQNYPGSPLGLPGVAGVPGVGPGIPGIAGTGAPAAGGNLWARFKAHPKRKEMIYGAVVITLLFFWLSDDDQPVNKAPRPQPSVSAIAGAKTGPTFESLSPEQQKFVTDQHNLAFENYRAGEYDQALFFLSKIFDLLPDYLDSRELERYSKEGQRVKQAQEEEKKKKEKEKELKAKIAQLEEEGDARMRAKHYEQAREIFSEILQLDPDNAKVVAWRKQIEEADEQDKLHEQMNELEKAKNDRAWQLYRQGLALKKAGKFHTALSVLREIPGIGARNKKITKLAAGLSWICRKAIQEKLDPVLADAKQAEANQEYPKAYELYGKAIVIDPNHPDGYQGQDRIRGVLHDKAKAIYTEAVLAESYSDFTNAKKKFKECLEIAPKTDVYYERAQRKLARYFKSALKEDIQ